MSSLPQKEGKTDYLPNIKCSKIPEAEIVIMQSEYSPDTWFKQKFAQMLDKRTKLFESLMKSA